MNLDLGIAVAFATLAAVIAMMLVELQLSRHNERVMRARGAVEPPGDVYRAMRIIYPASFVAMAVEGAIVSRMSAPMLLAGIGLFGLAKILKFWAIASLGVQWTFRLLVVPGSTLVKTGPYRFLRHPNYVAVCGELLAIAIALSAPVAGIISFVVFSGLLLRRIALEERALGIRP
jgi:methyltransferase